MKVKFKGNIEPCIQYEVKQGMAAKYFDDLHGRYFLSLYLEVLGLVPEKLLEEATHPDNINAIDVSNYLAIK